MAQSFGEIQLLKVAPPRGYSENRLNKVGPVSSFRAREQGIGIRRFSLIMVMYLINT